MKMISPSNREVDIGQTLADDEYIGMVRREVMDGFMRDRAIELVRVCPSAGACGLVLWSEDFTTLVDSPILLKHDAD